MSVHPVCVGCGCAFGHLMACPNRGEPNPPDAVPQCPCGERLCKGVDDGDHHSCGGPKEACMAPGCKECGTPPKQFGIPGAVTGLREEIARWQSQAERAQARVVELEGEIRAWEETAKEYDAMEARIHTIADEANGLHPPGMSAEDCMTQIERALFEQRKRADAALATVETLRGENEQLHICLDLVSGALMDAGNVVVPEDMIKYGDAVRTLTAERDQLRSALRDADAMRDKLYARVGQMESEMKKRAEVFQSVCGERDRAIADRDRTRNCKHLERTPDGSQLCYLNGSHVIVLGTPDPCEDENDPRYHNCDEMGCGWEHVIKRLRVVEDAALSAPAVDAGGGAREAAVKLREALEPFMSLRLTCPHCDKLYDHERDCIVPNTLAETAWLATPAPTGSDGAGKDGGQ